MRITITCEECGRRHRLERSVADPGSIWIVCHDCELPLRAVLEAPDSTVPTAFQAAWGGMIDLSSPSEASTAS
jgi:hypothetical protein